MKNLIPPALDHIELFREAVRNKTNEAERTALTTATAIIEGRYQVYAQHYGTNQLELLNQDPACTPYKTPLLKLFSSKLKHYKLILEAISTLQPRTIRYTCQYCTIGMVKSMDHIVNKESYPEYSIHPLNLIPCCLECNSNKGEYWKQAGNRLFINPYIDLLPNQQYLFTRITGTANEMDFTFELQEPAGIDPRLWSRISNHYERLHLLDRMRKGANSEVIELIISAKKSREKGLTIGEIGTQIMGEAAAKRQYFGFNYWKASLEEALANSPIYWECVDNFRL